MEISLSTDARKSPLSLQFAVCKAGGVFRLLYFIAFTPSLDDLLAIANCEFMPSPRSRRL